MSVPVHFVGVGVTPPKTTAHKKLYYDTLSCATSIILRDNESHRQLNELGIDRPITTKPDIAFYYSETDPPPEDITKSAVSDSLVVVLRDVWWLPVDLEGLAEAINRHCNKFDCTIKVTEYAGNDSDRRMVKKFAQMLNQSVEIFISRDFRQLEQIAKQSRYVVGMRLHSIIFAAKHAVPFLSVAYNPKCQYVPQQFGYPNVNWCVDIDPDAVADTIANAWDDFALRRQLAEYARSQHAKASTIFDNISIQTVNTSWSSRYRIKILSKYIRLRWHLYKRLGIDQASVLQDTVPEDPQKLYAWK